MHLKQHYEPAIPQDKRKEVHIQAASPEDNMLLNMAVPMTLLREKIEEVLDYSQEGIRNEELPREPLPEMDEFNEFSEPDDADMMEDLRKEVDKVVETIDDNECLPDATWNYQVETDEQSDNLQLYSDNLIQSNANSSIDTTFEEINNAETDAQTMRDEGEFESEDEEDDKPLEQVRQSLQKPSRIDNPLKKFPHEDDKEDIELTECLKKIHNFKCNACNKAFNSRTALGYHLKTHNTEVRLKIHNIEETILMFYFRGAMFVTR